jgi:pimeloyl-ACP methyl ester carboxylesterase
MADPPETASPGSAEFVPGAPLAARPGVRLLGEPIFARVMGQGPPMVLIHGLAVSGDMYAPVAGQLARDHQLIIPDLRGQGSSGAMPGPYTAVRLADDVAGLLSRLGMRQATVLGYSQGGPVALQLARDHPGLVGRLVLACTYAFNMASRRERVEGFLMPWMFRILGPRRLGAFVRRRPGITGGKPLTRQQAEFVAGLIAETPRAAAAALAGQAMAFDARPWLADVAMPTLVVAGAEDAAVPAHHARMLADGIAGATLAEVAGAGHMLICTHPSELVGIIRDWEAATASRSR